ncbi:MAG: SH3 domain-containing protein [Gammaproteobacteria bacterium]|nr:SH3 domain-containing protein [Gammaproteobacteria bacterium]
MLRVVAALLLLLSSALCGAVEPSQSASEAMQKGDYAVAYHLWIPQARSGDKVAQYNIGWMYHNGYGLVIDDDQARHWWELSANQGYTEAQFALAMLYTQGTRQIKKSLEVAVPYYLDAARGGHEDARVMLLTLFGGPNDRQGHRLAMLLSEEDWALLGKPLQIKTRRANLRRDATLEAAIIRTLKQGQQLLEVGIKNKWVQVIDMDKGSRGWMHASLLEAPSDATPSPPDGPYSSDLDATLK